MGTVLSKSGAKSKGNENDTHYTKQQVAQLRAIYLAFVLFWIILIIYLELYKEDSIVLGLMCIPILIFIYEYLTVEEVEREIEDQVFVANYLSISLLVVLPLFFNLTKVVRFMKPLKLVIIAVIFILLGLIDIWVPRKLVPFARHFKACLETVGLILLIIAVYLIYQRLYSGGLCEIVEEECEEIRRKEQRCKEKY